MVDKENGVFEELENEISAANEELNSKNEEIKQLETKMQDVEQVDCRSIFVGNVDFSTSPDELREFFKECGEIERVTIPLDRTTRHPKGFAYIEFADISGVDKSQSFNDKLFKGRKLKVMPKRTNIPGVTRPRSRISMHARRGMFYPPRARFYKFRPY